ncbi:MAG TPA: L-lysine 6-transaminase [Verrucomicrobiae bacterium]|nr:L-lysine 6-transaminase [Verrucomicrobiae bacterium]
MHTVQSVGAKSSRKKPAPRISGPGAVPPKQVVAELEKHLLVDGFKLVIDLEKSRGSNLVDATTGKSFIDCYSFYASMPVGFNHPYFDDPAVQADMLRAAKFKVANADVYSVAFATFVQTFARVMGMPPMDRYFFIDGGALAVENALKAAMDWKVRKNMATGRGERGTEILHFTHAFHGRSGYTMSLTNTDPRKTDLFAKFPWPRVSTPFLDFSLAENDRLQNVIESEKLAESQIRRFIAERGQDLAAIIIETIQGEGGDNHFRGEWLRLLRRICDENDLLLIFDEVQAGMGVTGRNWCCQHFDVLPDLLVFGKKAQVCGVMAGPRLDEVKDNVFRVPSRISSTWGGNFCDYVRSTHFLRIIESEKLVENARLQGARLLEELRQIAKKHPAMTAVRGRGLLLAFDLPTRAMRDQFWSGAYESGLLVLRCGERSIRLRPVLDFKDEVLEATLELIEAVAKRLPL